MWSKRRFVYVIDLTVISWVPLVALVIYKISLMGGIYSTSNVLASELFPVEVKSSAFAFISISREILLFLVNLGFDWSIHSFGIYSVFWMYAVLCLALSVFAFVIMPETKGKNLEEIQVLLDWPFIFFSLLIIVIRRKCLIISFFLITSYYLEYCVIIKTNMTFIFLLPYGNSSVSLIPCTKDIFILKIIYNYKYRRVINFLILWYLDFFILLIFYS